MLQAQFSNMFWGLMQIWWLGVSATVKTTNFAIAL